MDCVIAFRNPRNGEVGFVREENGSASVFPHIDDAVIFAQSHKLLQAWPYQIVQLDEL